MFVSELKSLNKEWIDITQHIGMKALKDKDEVGAASVDYLMYSGYVVLAYFWARMAKVAQEKLQEQHAQKEQKETAAGEFYAAKLTTATFYYQRLLPRTRSLVQTMQSGAANLMELDEDSFRF
jgi:hypothetical protein